MMRTYGARLGTALACGCLLQATFAFGAASVHGEEPVAAVGPALAAATPAEPSSREALFGDDIKPVKKDAGSGLGLRGFVQSELAYTVGKPSHWSKILTRAELGSQGSLSERVKWKLSARLDYDAVYDLTDFYPSEVRNDQRLNLYLRENYLDVGAGNWDFRLGRQHIVWGEVVGLFFADVVSAKDLREFILPEFDILRIPQWAARAEYSHPEFHAEFVWIPVATYDEIGKPGAEFFPPPPPAPPGFAVGILNDDRPERKLSTGNYGLRLSTLRDGWDLSGFYYRSMDATPTYYRQVIAGPQPTFIYQPRHNRIHQYGATLTKDFRSFVLRSEAIYTRGRQYSVQRLADPDGVVPQETLDWIASLDFTLPRDTRLNLQLFQRVFFGHDSDIIPDKYENGYSVLVNHKLTNALEAQVLFISSLNRTDWLLRPSLAWNFEKNWRWRVGVDVLQGPSLGFFGRFDNRDRIYTDLRYSF